LPADSPSRRKKSIAPPAAAIVFAEKNFNGLHKGDSIGTASRACYRNRIVDKRGIVKNNVVRHGAKPEPAFARDKAGRMLPRRAVKREGALLQFPVSGLRPGSPCGVTMRIAVG
jgi:hypothetical protein